MKKLLQATFLILIVLLFSVGLAQAATKVFPSQGGTGISTYATGDILYSDTGNSLAKLGIGTSDYLLMVSGGLPVWKNDITTIGTGSFGDLVVDTNVLVVDATNDRVGIGTNAPDSIFHIKANVSGTVGSHPAGQLIIQDPDDSVFGNAVITGYESDGAGNPDQQLWYLGSSSSSNAEITFLNRRNAKLHLGTNGVSRLTILGNGNVGIGDITPASLLTVGDGDLFQVNATGDLTTTGDINLADDSYLYLDTAKTYGLKYSSYHTEMVVPEFFSAEADLLISTNTGATADGTWEPYLYFSDDGSVWLKNTTQGANKYFKVDMTDGIHLDTGGGGDAILKTDNLSSHRTFQFPNVAGTLIGTGNLSDITTVGTLTGLTVSGVTTLATIDAGVWQGTAIDIANYLTIANQATGDVLYYTGSNWARLALGTAGQALTATGDAVYWSTISGAGDMLKSTYDVDEDNEIDVAGGGTEKDSWTQYAIPYLSAATTFGEITIATADYALTVNAGANGYDWTDMWTEAENTAAGYISATLTEEQVEDFVGGMLGGTETLIAVDYQDASNDIDFVVNDDLSLYDNSSSAFITATLTQEQVEDYSGGLFGGTETLITVTYNDATGDVSFVVDNDLSNYDNSSSAFITATLTEEQVEDFVGGMLGGTETHIAVDYVDGGVGAGSINFVVADDWWDALTDMALAENYIYVGDASSDPVAVAMSNDCTIASNGAITCNHDALDNFLAAEHVDWAGAGTGTIHTDNYVENATHSGEVTGSGALTIAANIVDGTNIALGSDATGDIMYYNGVDYARLPIATADFVLSITAGILDWEGDYMQDEDVNTFSELDAWVTDKALVNKADGAVWLGVHDFGGVTSFELPNLGEPTVNAEGEIAIDATDDQLIYYSGGAVRTLTYKKQVNLVRDDPASGDAITWSKQQDGITITDIHCIVDPAGSGQSAIINVKECDSTGDNCLTVDAAITCDNDGAEDDGSLANGVIDAGDWVSIDIGTVTATPDRVTTSIYYYTNRE